MKRMVVEPAAPGEGVLRSLAGRALGCVLVALLAGAGPAAGMEAVALRLERSLGTAAGGASAPPADTALGLGAVGLRWRILESRDRLHRLREEGAALRGRLSEQSRAMERLRAADGERERDLEMAWLGLEAARLQLAQHAGPAVQSPASFTPSSSPVIARERGALAPDAESSAPAAAQVGPGAPVPQAVHGVLLQSLLLFAGATVLLVLAWLVLAARRGNPDRSDRECEAAAVAAPRPAPADAPAVSAVDPKPSSPRARPVPTQRPQLRLVAKDGSPTEDQTAASDDSEPALPAADAAGGCKVLHFTRVRPEGPSPRG
jgi:hypothetical protein